MKALGILGRVGYSAYYIVDGYRLATRPAEYSRRAPGIGFAVGILQGVLRSDLADQLPTDAVSWTRILGIIEMASGLALASGVAGRICPAALATMLVPEVIEVTQSGDYEELAAPLAMISAGLAATALWPRQRR